ncbi:hypothetical protein [Actinoalloteichus sp. GBA129-24]|uniref:hypothetical protein n=1 Tax=Actinoalloteichus sp. GBA129-24 TaxID=1612551 RepID=UPI0009507751|nr:hypothetical protein [Actinoalloteichus sp. GBA129-24]APU23063.1 hypothetical protein UA75_25425 [Actinoalloteichus sp. GBA129-24]
MTEPGGSSGRAGDAARDLGTELRRTLELLHDRAQPVLLALRARAAADEPSAGTDHHGADHHGADHHGGAAHRGAADHGGAVDHGAPAHHGERNAAEAPASDRDARRAASTDEGRAAGHSGFAGAASEDSARPTAEDEAAAPGTPAGDGSRVGGAAEAPSNSCGWCPLCAAIGLFRGERPELGLRLAEQAMSLLDAVRAMVHEPAAGAESNGPTSAESNGQTSGASEPAGSAADRAEPDDDDRPRPAESGACGGGDAAARDGGDAASASGSPVAARSGADDSAPRDDLAVVDRVAAAFAAFGRSTAAAGADPTSTAQPSSSRVRPIRVDRQAPADRDDPDQPQSTRRERTVQSTAASARPGQVPAEESERVQRIGVERTHRC